MIEPNTKAKTSTKTSAKVDIHLCLDVGKSATKVLYQTSSSSNPSFLMMGPEMEPIESHWLKSYLEFEGALTSPAPEQEAYLKWNDQTYVLGHFAHRFSPEDRIEETKYENASFKALAAIGVIVQKETLPTKKVIRVSLAVLLPKNEYDDRFSLQERLEEMLADYEFRGQRLRVKLEKFVCKPEGFGLAMIRMREKGVDYFRNKNIGVLMLGHYNCTALAFEAGAMRGESPAYGFSQMLDTVIERTSGLSRDVLATAIYKTLNKGRDYLYNKTAYVSKRPPFASYEAFQALGRSSDPKWREKEVDKVVLALSLATEEYWARLERWLKKVFPSGLQEVIISGGPSVYLKPELEQYFNCRPKWHEGSSYQKGYWGYEAKDYQQPWTPIVWGAGLNEQLDSFSWFRWISGKEDNALNHRLVDCYGLFDYLMQDNNK